ncbi:MAG: MATE family efflux transporter [Lachnospiraceae bacterium]|nr:MATE family efflux transporter [Lachnospiraceae bacterium]
MAEAAAEEKRSNSAQIDLTQGDVRKGFFKFMWPIILGNIFTQIYNMVDSIVVGQFVGGEALAAVGACFTLTLMIYAFCIAVGSGATVVISQKFGAHDKEGVNLTANTALVLALIVGAILTVVFLILAKPLLLLLHTPANIFDDALTYFIIIIIATIGHLYYQMGSSILRGLGDSVWPLGLLIFCSVFNIFGDIVLVAGFKMGVAGAAWATLIAQLISGIAVVIRLCGKKYGITVNSKTLRIDGKTAATMLRIGIPAGLQQFVMSAGSSVIQRFTNSFGSDVVAAQSAVIKIDGFIMLPMMAISTASQTFVGQNIGAGKMDRVKEGSRFSISLTIIISLVLGIFLMIVAPYAVRLFTSEEAIVYIGTVGLRTLGFFYAFMGLSQTLTGIVRGAGASTMPMLASLVNICLRILLAYLFAIKGVININNELYRGLWIAMIICNGINMVIMLIYYFKGNWRSASKKIVQNQPQS